MTPESQFTYSGTELDSLAEARNYYTWVLKQFQPWLTGTVVEVGAGIGTFSDFILSQPRVEKIVAIEPAENTFPTLRSRFAGNSRIEIRKGYLTDYYRGLSANAVIAVNVLEHVRDDAEFLREAHTAVVPGGALLLFVPAIPAIYGSLDVAFEHHRRYTRRTLRTVIEKAGWKPRRISYMNLPGIAAWFMAGRVLRKKSVAPADAKAYDRLVIPWLSRLESIVPAPIGSNLVAIAVRE